MWPETGWCRSRNRRSSPASHRLGPTRSPKSPTATAANGPSPSGNQAFSLPVVQQSIIDHRLSVIDHRQALAGQRMDRPIADDDLQLISPPSSAIPSDPSSTAGTHSSTLAVDVCFRRIALGPLPIVPHVEGGQRIRQRRRSSLAKIQDEKFPRDPSVGQAGGRWPWPLQTPRPAWLPPLPETFLYTLFISHSSGCHIPFIFLC